MELVRVAINDADEIASGMRRGNRNVLERIRRGDDSLEFERFDQKPVIYAWAAKPGYKVWVCASWKQKATRRSARKSVPVDTYPHPR